VRDVRSIEREIQWWIHDNNKRQNREMISIPMERNEVYIPVPCCGLGTAYVLLTMAVDT
jgi:hypothetical protein